MNIFEEDIVTQIDTSYFKKIFTPEIHRVVEVIRKYGFDVRVVGGAVRDFLLGKPPRDVDFATDADPAELILIFDLEGIQYDAGGIEHGTIKAVFGDEKVDVTSIAYKIEVSPKGKMQIVRGADWKTDALERDLTINSLSLDVDGNIHDYTNGVSDLQKSIIRLNKCQYDKIPKRPETIMRWFKALAYFNNPIWPKEDYELVKNNLHLLSKVKNEKPVAKTLASLKANPEAEQVLRIMCKLGANRFIDLDCKQP